jgi:hypothetical protein
MNDTLLSRLPGNKNAWIFLLLWLLTFALYIPAARAGWVIDAVGFLYNLKHEPFLDFINRTHSGDQSFYQVLTLQYYIGYKLWGMNPWAWSLLYITLQAANAFLLFIVCSRLFSDSGLKNAILVPFIGVLFFTICPHISEVVICKAYYHYLQSFLFILSIMLLVQKYQHEQRNKYVWISLSLFLLSVFTLEIFYIIPFFVLTIALYYRFALGYDKPVFSATIKKFFIPQLILLAVYFIALYATYGNLRVHKIGISQSTTDYLSKLPKYLFHIILLGRYFAVEDKKAVYAFLESPIVLAVFYGALIIGSLVVLARFQKIRNDAKVMFLLFTWTIMTLVFVIPLAFPGYSLLIFYDRYTYFSNAFIYMLLAMFALRLKNKYITYALFIIYSIINLYFTNLVNTYWKQSDKINTSLLNNLPDAGDKTVLLLNIPENMNGAPMIGAQHEGEFKTMHEVYTGVRLRNNIYDVASCNMSSDTDGVYVIAVNDSTVDVALSQWGSWWWYDGQGAKDYENGDYKVKMVNPSRWYELTLKKPAVGYLLLYSVGDKWKAVDMNNRHVKQH